MPTPIVLEQVEMYTGSSLQLTYWASLSAHNSVSEFEQETIFLRDKLCKKEHFLPYSISKTRYNEFL